MNAFMASVAWVFAEYECIRGRNYDFDWKKIFRKENCYEIVTINEARLFSRPPKAKAELDFSRSQSSAA
jgi:hypothetical protein